MERSDQLIRCFSCGGWVADMDGPTHAYILSSPGCWQLYGKLLSGEYLPGNYDPTVHGISVDTYAVQHPGIPERRAIQSVNFHLLRLYAVFEKALHGPSVSIFLKRAVENKDMKSRFRWLDPPSFAGTMTVTDVLEAQDVHEHAVLVRKWGESVWNAWKARHAATIFGLAGALMGQKNNHGHAGTKR